MWSLQHSIEECTPYLLDILLVGLVNAQTEGVGSRGFYLASREHQIV